MVKNSMNKMVKLIFSCALVSTFVLIDQAFAGFCDNPKGSVEVCIGKKCKKMPSASICRKKTYIYFDDGENATPQVGRPSKPSVLPKRSAIVTPSAVAPQPVMPTTGPQGVPGVQPTQPGQPGVPGGVSPQVQGQPGVAGGMPPQVQDQPGVAGGMPPQVQGQPGSSGDCSIKSAQYCVGKRCQAVQVQANGDTQEIILPRSIAKGSRKVILGDAPSGNGPAPQSGGAVPQGGLVSPQGTAAQQMAQVQQGALLPPQQGTAAQQSAPAQQGTAAQKMAQVQQGRAGVGTVACVPGKHRIQYCTGSKCKTIKNKCNGNLITFDPIDSGHSMIKKTKKNPLALSSQ